MLFYIISAAVESKGGKGVYMVVSLFASIVHCSDNCLHYSTLSSVSPFGILNVFTTLWISHENIFINLLLALLLWSVRMSQTQVGFSPVNRRHIGRHFSKLHKKNSKEILNSWGDNQLFNNLSANENLYIHFPVATEFLLYGRLVCEHYYCLIAQFVLWV